MRVVCRHGHFAFYPGSASDLAYMSQVLGTDLAMDGDFYTFPRLVGAPRYAIMGHPYINLPAVETYEGEGPWDVMRENGFVYSLMLKVLVPKMAITSIADVSRATMSYINPGGLIQPGSIVKTGLRIMSYEGSFNLSSRLLRIQEATIE